MMRRTTALIIGALVATLSCYLQALANGEVQQRPSFESVVTERPIALAILGEGLVILGDAGRLQVLTAGDPKPTSIGRIERSLTAVDLAAARVDGSDWIVVTIWSPAASETGSRLLRFSKNGQIVDQVFLGHALFTGVAIDPASKAIWVANGETSEISKVSSLEAKLRLRFFAEVSGASGLGPMALDLSRQELFVGDQVHGRIYAISTRTKRIRRLADNLGEPAALAVDSVRGRLYIADATRRRIHVISTDKQPLLSDFARSLRLREPRGLALTNDGKLWVADTENRQLLLISQEGSLLRTIQQ